MDPRTDEYRYVGKSVRGVKRAESHLTHSHNPLVNEWVNELRMDNYVPEIIILENVPNWAELTEKEKYWVGKLINEGNDLFNVFITHSYDCNMGSYNKKLKEQIKKEGELLQGKLLSLQNKMSNEKSKIGIVIEQNG